MYRFDFEDICDVIDRVKIKDYKFGKVSSTVLKNGTQ